MSRGARVWIAFVIASVVAGSYVLGFFLVGNPFDPNAVIVFRGYAVGAMMAVCTCFLYLAIYLCVRKCTDPVEIPTFPEPSYV